MIYLHQLNPHQTGETYIKLIKRILPWMCTSVHRWLKKSFVSPPSPQLPSNSGLCEEFDSHLPFAFLWYITNWLVSKKALANEGNPIDVFEKVCRQEYLTNIYDSDDDGYSIVTLCQRTYPVDGPLLMMFYCSDERVFAIVLEEALRDSSQACR